MGKDARAGEEGYEIPEGLIEGLMSELDPESIYNIVSVGHLYFDDDFTKKWLIKSAEQGYVPAQGELGRISGRPGNHDESIKWLTMAAENGHLQSQCVLGLIYEGEMYKEDGKYIDLEKSIYWHNKAAKQNMANSQYELAEFYYNGKGTAVDYDKAFYWLEKATTQKLKDSAIGSYFVDESGFEFSLYNAAFSLLGDCYKDGKGTKQDYKKAIEAWKVADTPYSQNEIANCYRDGKGVVQNIQEAVKWWTSAVQGGSQEAKTALKEQAAKTVLWNGFRATMSEEQVKERIKSLYKLDGNIDKQKMENTDVIWITFADLLKKSGLYSSPPPTPDFSLFCKIEDNVFDQKDVFNLSFDFYKRELYGVSVSWAIDIKDDIIAKTKENYGFDYSCNLYKHYPKPITNKSSWQDKALNNFDPYSTEAYLWQKDFIYVYLNNINVENAYGTFPKLTMFVFSKQLCDAAHEDELQAQKEEKARQQKALDDRKEKITF